MSSNRDLQKILISRTFTNNIMINTYKHYSIASGPRQVGRVICMCLLIAGIAACEELTLDDPDAPTVSREIQDQQMKADDDPLEFDLSQFFEPPGDVPLEYRASSSDTDVLEAMVDDETLILEPTGGGKAMVTAEAGHEDIFTDMNFEVKVTLPDPPNRPD